MPRDGSGHSHNAEEQGEHITHGAPDANDTPAVSGVDRSHKAAPAPDHDAGEGLKDVGSSGQGSDQHGSGKGPIKSTVQDQAEKLSK